MNLKVSALIAVALSMLFLISWEAYWYNQGYIPTITDDKHLYSINRAKLDNLSEEDIVLVGSSRILFNIQLDVFESVTGIKPLQLAIVGSSPLPTFHDIVHNSDFKGTVIVGVTPGLFFSTTFPKAPPIEWPQNHVDHYHERTPADRLNFALSLPLQKRLNVMDSYDEVINNKTDLKSLINKIDKGDRTGKPTYPLFGDFSYIDVDRNTRMREETVTDTSFSNEVKAAWKFVVSSIKMKPDKKSTIEFFAKDVAVFKERGGKVILLRNPSSGFFEETEAKNLPRATYFDSLVSVVKTPSYHFADYPQLSKIDCCPEWSHLSGPNADIFTEEFANILIEDNHITSKNN